MKVTPFFANRGFYPRMSLSLDTTDYDSTRKRIAAAKVDDIIDYIERILEFIQGNIDVA